MSHQQFYETVQREQEQQEQGMKVYQAINKVQAALCKQGISKDHRNSQGAGYNFRGIDDVYNAVSPLLAEHGLCILPRMISRQCEERQSKSGGALFYITVEAEFDFVSAEDGSTHTVRTFGEAMDSGDKGTNKAMSAAYKYAAFQAFAIPTEGDNDADARTHEVASKPKSFKATPTDGPVDVPEDRQTLMTLAASVAVELFKAGEKDAAYDKLADFLNDNEEHLYLYDKVLKPHSTLRAYIKFRREQAAKRTQEEATA